MPKPDLPLSVASLTAGRRYREAVAEMDRLQNGEAQGADLHDGWNMVSRRSDWMDAVLLGLFDEFLRRFGGDGRLLFAATGGYGRRELTAASDVDCILFADDSLLDNGEFQEAWSQVNQVFMDQIYHRGVPINSPEDTSGFIADKLSGLLDLRRLYPPKADVFVSHVSDQLRHRSDRLSLALSKYSVLEGFMGRGFEEYDDLSNFDIKNDLGGLRHLYAALWARCVATFRPSGELKPHLPRDLREYLGILFKLRNWLYFRSEGRARDRLAFEDLKAAAKHFGMELLPILMHGRARVKRFAHHTFHEELRKGFPITPYLRYLKSGLDVDAIQFSADPDKVFFNVMRLAQKEKLSLSARTFNLFERKAKAFVGPSNYFLDLFAERGSLSHTLRLLLAFELLRELWPGWGPLENELYSSRSRRARNTRAIKAIRGLSHLEFLVSENQRVEGALEELVATVRQEWDHLDPGHRFAVKAALLSQDIPRLAGWTVDEFIAGLSRVFPTLDARLPEDLAFLLRNRELFTRSVAASMPDRPETVAEVRAAAGGEDRLRLALVFTAAHFDLGKTGRIPANQWRNILALFRNALREGTAPTPAANLDPARLHPQERELVEGIPSSFMRSPYAPRLHEVLTALRRVGTGGQPLLRLDLDFLENTGTLFVVSRDFRGLVWRICGACLEVGADIREADIFTFPAAQRMAFDFFYLAFDDAQSQRDGAKTLLTLIRGSIDGTRIPTAEPRVILDRAGLEVRLEALPTGWRLAVHGSKNEPGILYAISRILAEYGDIEGVRGHTHQDGTFTDNLFFTSNLPREALMRLPQKISRA